MLQYVGGPNVPYMWVAPTSPLYVGGPNVRQRPPTLPRGSRPTSPGSACRRRSCIREAAEWVVRLYEGWGQPEKAAAWKARLGLTDLPADVFARP